MNPLESPADHPLSTGQPEVVHRRVFLAIAVSGMIGVAWHFVAIAIMGDGSLSDGARWMGAGVFAGLCCGAFTVWSRRRNSDRESVLSVVFGYYLGMIAYWLGILFIENVVLVIGSTRSTNIDLHDNLKLIFWFFLFGTCPFGFVLLPLSFLSRLVVWHTYSAPRKHGG